MREGCLGAVWAAAAEPTLHARPAIITSRLYNRRYAAGGLISTTYTNLSLLASGLVLRHCNYSTVVIHGLGANRDADGCRSMLHSRSQTLRRVRIEAGPTLPPGFPCRKGAHLTAQRALLQKAMPRGPAAPAGPGRPVPSTPTSTRAAQHFKKASMSTVAHVTRQRSTMQGWRSTTRT